jgi:hypothetical protein
MASYSSAFNTNAGNEMSSASPGNEMSDVNPATAPVIMQPGSTPDSSRVIFNFNGPGKDGSEMDYRTTRDVQFQPGTGPEERAAMMESAHDGAAGIATSMLATTAGKNAGQDKDGNPNVTMDQQVGMVALEQVLNTGIGMAGGINPQFSNPLLGEKPLA